MTVRRLFVAALLAVIAASPAAAQFTATVAPPKPKATPTQVAVRQQVQAQADSARRTQVTEMRAWVDSAAQAATGRPVVSQDSTTVTTTTDGATTTTTTRSTVAMPATATSLPILLLAGLLLVAAGALMVRPEGTAEPARARRDRR